ncbi:MAG TPA: serine/threonine-protein kinase [Polyangium sp.]|nr:serine/threonine-protein kinase [Polyangium sp.]
MHLAPGQTVSRYVIEALLGEGGMGKVYRARDTRLERHVALKVLRKQSDEGASEAWEQAVMRMQREAQAVAALSHPGIVAIYDIGEHDGAPFIAMELVTGKPLREFVGADLPISVRQRILLDVARALAAAHEAGFMHRDIKPDNILVRPDNSAKVLDFGIARRTSHVEATATIDVQGATIDSALLQMTADGVLLGTPAYMAPEQLRGETLDARADQFGAGIWRFPGGRARFSRFRGPIEYPGSEKVSGSVDDPLRSSH